MNQMLENQLRQRTVTAICFIACWLAIGSVRLEAVHAQADTTSEFFHDVHLPLDDGHLAFGELLGTIVDELGMNGDILREQLTWSLDLSSAFSRGPMKAIESMTKDVVEIQIEDDVLQLSFDEIRMRREERRMRSEVRSFLERWFPEAAEKFQAQFGLWICPTLGRRVKLEDFNFENTISSNQSCVVLVHGLDDPGKIWNSLRPTLINNGFLVCEFDYPNDQSITDSAQAFAIELAALRAQGIGKISIVSHSMGGLVSREVLTNLRYYASDPMGGTKYPNVLRFVMVGTPNHGSSLVRLRFGAEIRDQIARTLSGKGHLFGGFFDGAGEAKIDLLPESEFLNALNARPHPLGMPITIIAGDASPFDQMKMMQAVEAIRNDVSEDAAESINALMKGLNDLADGVGDGCVSLESTRLTGVDDYTIVPGTHLTMIRNAPWQSDDRIPPAVPIILERLSSDH